MDVKRLFATHGLRCTKQRELVYAALASTDAHPTAEELHTAAKRHDPGLSLATVYNTLDALTAAGLALRVPSLCGPGPCRYCAGTDAHVHVSIDGTRLADLPEDLSRRLLGALPKELIEEIERRMGVRVRGVNVQIDAEADPR